MRLLLLLVLVALVVFAVMTVVRRARMQRAAWAAHTRSLGDGRVVVELRRLGEAPVTIAELPAGMEGAEWEDRLFAAQSDAEQRARMLNLGG